MLRPNMLPRKKKLIFVHCTQENFSILRPSRAAFLRESATMFQCKKTGRSGQMVTGC